jgi:hypothetical protein
MAKRVLIGSLGAFLLLGAILWIPWATEKRGYIASTPVPPPLFGVTPATLGPGQNACLTQVTLDAHSQIGQIGASTPRNKPGPPLQVTASAPGYYASTRISGGYSETAALQFRLTPPAKPLLATVCVTNEGKEAMSLHGTGEFRTMGRPRLLIDGVEQPFDAQLAFYAAKPKSYAARAGAIFRHAAIFTPPWLPAALIALLGLLALVAVPLGVLRAFAIAASDEEPARREQELSRR